MSGIEQRFAPGSTGALRNTLRTICYLAVIRLHRRYVGSAIGALWSLLHPLATTLILIVVFTNFMRVPITNYALYLVAGAIPWGFISGGLTTASQSLIGRREVLQSSLVSPAVFVLADVFAEFITFVVAYAVLLVLAALIFQPPAPIIALLPLTLLPLVIFTFAASIPVAYLAVRFRDIPHILQIFFAMMFWLVPIVYSPDMVPEPYRNYIIYNPFSLLIQPPVILAHGGAIPSARLLGGGIAVGLATIAIAWFAHRRLGRDIIYRL